MCCGGGLGPGRSSRVSSELHRYPTCFACGAENPNGLHGTFAARGDEVLGTMVVTDIGRTGPPARRDHDGVLRRGMGLITMHLGAETMTASLTVDLRAPVSWATLRQRAWLEAPEGRKWFLRGEVHEADRLVAEARGLWIEPRPRPSAAPAASS